MTQLASVDVMSAIDDYVAKGAWTKALETAKQAVRARTAHVKHMCRTIDHCWISTYAYMETSCLSNSTTAVVAT
jgi:hypothetical protein